MSESAEPMVANPYRQRLGELRAELVGEAEAVRTALDDPARDLGGGDVWVGPVARRWWEELEGRRQRLRALTEGLVAAVDAELRAQPEQVTASMARAMGSDLR